MEKRQLFRMLCSFVLPPVLVLVLFTVAISVFILPETEEALMQKKKDTVRAIVVSAVSILERHAQLAQKGVISLDQAQQLALSEMRALRYGDDLQEYVWITDQQPVMLMHPYFPELENTRLDKFADSRGTLLFIEAEAVTRGRGEGYINYLWAKGTKLEETVPKLSYVKLHKSWGWVIGSGIYLDDVQVEIRKFSLRLLLISGLIGTVVVVLLMFVVHRGWKSETGRYLAEKELRRSRERYKALAQASDEMLFLVIDGTVAGANKKACDNLEMKESELIGRNYRELVTGETGQALIRAVEEGESVTPVETGIQGKSGVLRVVLSAQHATVHNRPAILYTGCSVLGSEQQSDAAVGEILKQSGFGVVYFDPTENGKITFADATACLLLTGNSEQMPVDRHLAGFVCDEDRKRLFHQLLAKKVAAGVHLTLSGNGVRKLLAWAILLQEAGNREGQAAMVLLDDSEERRGRQAMEELLSACVSPEQLLLSDHLRSVPADIPDGNTLRFAKINTVMRLAMKEGLRTDRATAIAIRAIDRIFAAGVSQAIETLGEPPCPYALLAVGSIGRKEPMLNPDQDTAIIYADGEDEVRQDYFVRFGAAVTTFVAEEGLPPCDAGNSAANPTWCLSETAWRNRFTDWIQNGSPDDLLQVNIFFDLRTIVGDDTLTSRLYRQIFAHVSVRSVFLHNLAQSTIDFRLPVNSMGRLRAEGPGGNSLNLKGLMLHFVSFVRIYALRYGIAETNTLARLVALGKGEYLPPDLVRDTLDAWKYLLTLRFQGQIVAQEMNFSEKNILILDELGSWDETMLKMAAGQVSNLQRRLAKDFVRTA